jgi:ABC-type transport system substrate-binding protein
MKVSLAGRSVGLALALTLVGTAVTKAADSQRLTFTIHAAFFSSETKQPKTVDPHVFVQNAASPAATGPQNIQHVAGVRPALIEEDAKDTPLFNAKGESLGFDLGQWLAANGRVTITPSANGKAKISAQLSKLRPSAPLIACLRIISTSSPSVSRPSTVPVKTAISTPTKRAQHG